MKPKHADSSGVIIIMYRLSRIGTCAEVKITYLLFECQITYFRLGLPSRPCYYNTMPKVHIKKGNPLQRLSLFLRLNFKRPLFIVMGLIF